MSCAYYKLPERQAEVFKLIVAGAETKEIATQMGISTHTVNNYRERMYKTLGIRSRIKLVHFALHHKLVPNIYENS